MRGPPAVRNRTRLGAVPTEYLPVAQQLPRVREFLTEILPGGPRPGNREAAVEAILGELTGSDVSAWAAVTGGRMRAVFGAVLRHVTEQDPDYTYMPARYALVSLPRWHVRADDDWAYAPDLLDHISRDAARAGIERLSIDLPVDQGRGMRTILDAGFIPDVILAARPTRPGEESALPGVRIRTACDDDAPALLALTLEEADYHAEHTRSGIRANQDPGPSKRHVTTWLESQRTGGLPTFVAEAGGRVVGMLPLARVAGGGDAHVPEDYGYVASTCITASARGRGIGTGLVERALGAAHERGITMLLLHYVADNPTAEPFWTARGFTPVTATLTRHP